MFSIFLSVNIWLRFYSGNMYMNPNKMLWTHMRPDVRKSCLTLLNHTDFYQAGFTFVMVSCSLFDWPQIWYQGWWLFCCLMKPIPLWNFVCQGWRVKTELCYFPKNWYTEVWASLDFSVVVFFLLLNHPQLDD